MEKVKAKQRTIDPYGHEKLFEAYRQKRRHNPSPWELRMIALLKQMGIANERQHRLGTSFYTIDFYLDRYKVGIQMEGEMRPDSFKRGDWRARKRVLCAALGIELLTIHCSELGDDLSPVIARIEAAIAETRAKAA